MPARKRLAQRGFVLLICISVLALLALLASSFTLLSRTERDASRNYLDKARAKLLAESGVEAAIAQLKVRARSQAWEDLTGPSVYVDGPGIPIEYAKFPSFQAFQTPVPAPPSLPSPLTVASAQPPNFSGAPNTNGISGALEATYDHGWDCYVDKVLDCQSQVDLNATDPNMPGILEALGDAIATYLPTINYSLKTGRPVVNPIPSGRGGLIINLRTSNGGKFKSKYDLKTLPWMTNDMMLCLQDFVCVSCYRDPQAVVPNPNPAYPAPSFAPSTPSAGWMGRAPMNINTAPWPVLVAWVENVTGWRMSPPAPGAAGYVISNWGKALSTAIPKAQAYNIASRIIQARNGQAPFTYKHVFRTYDDVAHFISNPYWGNPQAATRDPWLGYDLVHDGIVNLAADQAATLIGLMDPSLTTNKYFESGASWNGVDKVDLQYYTWEVCFSSMGYFEVESMGRVLPPNPGPWINHNPPTPGQPPLSVAAEAKAKTVVKIYSVFRQTTQNDFVTGGTFTNTMSLPERTGMAPSSWEGAVTMPEKGLVNGSACAWAKTDSDYDWTRPSPNQGARGLPLSTSRTTASLAATGQLQPDGVTCIANSPQQLTYMLRNQPPMDEGALEFWVRLTTDPGVGSGEPLVYYLTTGNLVANLYTGGGAKIERFGTKLVATRWIWGYPSPSTSQYYFLMSTYQLGDISQWHLGSWHHLAMEWKDYVAPPVNGADVQSWENGAPEQRDFWFWIDGVQQGGFFQRWAPTTVQNQPGNVILTTKYRMLLASKTPPNQPPWPNTTIDLGGYTFNSPGLPIDYVNQSKNMPGGNVWLYSNSVIDNLMVYKSGSDPALPNATPGNPGWHHNGNLPGVPFSRYTAVSGATYGNTFDLTNLRNTGKISQNAVLGTISWQTKHPAWSATVTPAAGETNLWPTNGAGDQSPYATCSWPGFGSYPAQAGANTTVALGGLNYPVNSQPFNPPPAATIRLGAIPTLPYTLNFLDTTTMGGGSGNNPFNAVPVVEEVMITVIDSPQFLSWEAY